MKSKKIHLTAETKDINLQKVIILSVNENQSKELILLLLLLREGLSNSIEIILDNISIYLKLNGNENRSTCSFFDINKRYFKASISVNSLEFALFYLLKYYRDDIGEVEHIDLDFEYEKDKVVTIVIKIDLYKEISAEEMNKLLGL